MSTIAKRKFKCRYCSQKFAYFDTWRRHNLQHQEKKKKKEEKAKEKEEKAKAKLSAPKRKQPAAFKRENQDKDKKEVEKKAKAKLSAPERKQPAASKEESCNKDFVQGDASAFEAFLNQGIIDSSLDFLAEDVTNTNGEKQCSIESCILSDCSKDNCIFAQLEEPPVKKRKLSPVANSSKNTQRDKKPRIEHKKLPSGGTRDKKPRIEHKKLPSEGSRAEKTRQGQEKLHFGLYDPFLTKALEVNLNRPSGSVSAKQNANSIIMSENWTKQRQSASASITSENLTKREQSVSASITSEYLAKREQSVSDTKEKTLNRVSEKQSGLKLFFCLKCNTNFRCREDMEMHRDLHAVVTPSSDYF